LSAVTMLQNQCDANSVAATTSNHACEPQTAPEEGSAVSVALVGVGLLAQLSDLAVHRPLVVLVDDAQWIDASSLAVLTFVARRLLADATFILFACRPRESEMPLASDGDVSPVPFDARGLLTFELPPLSLDESVAHLVSEGFPAEVAARAAFAGGGLPLALAELVRVGASEASSMTATAMYLPSRLAERVLAMSPEALDAASYAALEPEYRVLERIYGESVGTVLDEGERAGVFIVDRDRVAFTHPLLRAAVLDTLDNSTMRRMHQRIATVLDPLTDADRRAIHLGHGADGRDDVAAECLDAFAERARRRGAHTEASDAFRRASELTTDHAVRSKRLLESGRTMYFAGDAKAGIEIAEEVLATATHATIREDAEVLLAYASMWERNPEVTMTRLVATSDAIADAEPGRAVWALIAASAMAFVTEDAKRGVDVGRRAEDAATRSGDAVASLAASGILGWNLFLTGSMDEAETRNAAMDPVVMMLVDQETVEGVSFGQNLAMRLIMSERFAEAESLLSRLLPVARRLGVELSVAMISMVTGALRWRQGLWDQAMLYTLAPLESEELPRLSNAWGHAIAAQLVSAIGDVEQTDAHVAAALETSAVEGSALIRSWARAALGHLRLSQGNYTAAVEQFAAVDADMSSVGLAQPEFFLWQGDYIEALIAVGDNVGAMQVIEQLETLPSCRDLAWCRGVSARSRGVLANDINGASEYFESALDEFASIGFPFELARTHLALGRAQANAGVGATVSLAKAKRLFTALGAQLWISVTDNYLGSGASEEGDPTVVPTPTRSRRWSEVLTTAEYRVALTVGSGRTNIEVASELYLSVRTVEFHLGAIYRKLNVKNRASLVSRLATEMQFS
jgi:DNA-binding CsgD family transcriptional regulator